jgi:hypothetical protein
VPSFPKLRNCSSRAAAKTARWPFNDNKFMRKIEFALEILEKIYAPENRINSVLLVGTDALRV